MTEEKTIVPKKLLVCVDGSKIASRATDLAIALAQSLASEVLFVNVVGAEISQRSYRITADMVGSFEKIGADALAECEERAKDIGLKYESVQLSGDPSEEILKFAREKGCDLIVIGRKGFGKIEKLFLGSVSERVLKDADVPVLLVK